MRGNCQNKKMERAAASFLAFSLLHCLVVFVLSPCLSVEPFAIKIRTTIIALVAAMVRIWVIPLQQRRPMGFTFLQSDTYADVLWRLTHDPLFNAIQVWDPRNGDYLTHVGPPIDRGMPLMDSFTFKAMSGPYEPEAERAANITTSDQGVGTDAPIIYFVDNSLVYNIYNDTPEPEMEHDFTLADQVSGLQLHNLFGNLLVVFPHWHATVIQRAFRRHLERHPPSYTTEDFFGDDSTASSENVLV